MTIARSAMIKGRRRESRIALVGLVGSLLLFAAALAALVYSALERMRDFDRTVANLLSYTAYPEQATMGYHWARLASVFGDVPAVRILGTGAFRAVGLNLYVHLTAQEWQQDPGPPPQPTAVDASLLALLGSLDRLERIHLEGILLPTDDFSPLTNLTELGHLSLRGTNITDSSLAIVGTFTQLDTLDLRKTQITDRGLIDLERLASLQQLFLQETEVTRLGVEELQESLPNCEIAATFLNDSARYRDKVHLAEALAKECFLTRGGPDGPLQSLRLVNSRVTKGDDDRFTVEGDVVMQYDEWASDGPHDYLAILEMEGGHWHLAQIRVTGRSIYDNLYDHPFNLILRE